MRQDSMPQNLSAVCAADQDVEIGTAVVLHAVGLVNRIIRFGLMNGLKLRYDRT